MMADRLESQKIIRDLDITTCLSVTSKANENKGVKAFCLFSLREIADISLKFSLNRKRCKDGSQQ